MTRRELLAGLLAAPTLAEARSRLSVPKDLRTPYKLERFVIGPSHQPGSFDEKSADVPFVFRHQGVFYMTYVGFDGVGYQTGLASSRDLQNWRREGVILKRNPASPVIRYNVALTWILRENNVFGPGELKKVRGRYLGLYNAEPGSGYEQGPGVIGLCWSRDLRNWEVEPPCLRPEDGAAWEHAGLYKACILEENGRYHIFYNAKNRPVHWHEQTGIATSRDLKTWVRDPHNPILRNGPPGSDDEYFASDPCVLKYRKEWPIFYYGLGPKFIARDLLALSPNLVTVRKCAGVLIDVGPKGSIDSMFAHKPSIISHAGVLYHFYCAVSKEFGRGISVARSRPWKT